MKKLKTIEKTTYFFTSGQNDSSNPVMNNMLAFWKHYDELFGTDHAHIIKTLSSPTALRYTLEGLAGILNISERTLLRYRKLYLESYNVCRKLHGDR